MTWKEAALPFLVGGGSAVYAVFLTYISRERIEDHYKSEGVPEHITSGSVARVADWIVDVQVLGTSIIAWVVAIIALDQPWGDWIIWVGVFLLVSILVRVLTLRPVTYGASRRVVNRTPITYGSACVFLANATICILLLVSGDLESTQDENGMPAYNAGQSENIAENLPSWMRGQ